MGRPRGASSSGGRRKIRDQVVESDERRQVTFSKRRAGLFKKASELSPLCGAHVAVVLFSQAGRAFCFGSPSVDDVVDRYLRGGVNAGAGVADFDAALAETRARLEEARARVAAERARLDAVVEAVTRARGERGHWWEADVGALGEEELREFEKSQKTLARLHANVARRADTLKQLPQLH